MNLLQDFWALATKISTSWVALASGLVGLGITIFERFRIHKKRKRELEWHQYITILTLCMLPPFFEAWHGLEDQLRALEKEKRGLSAELALRRIPPSVRVNSDNNSTTGLESPIVTGSENTITYGSRPSGKSVPKRSQEKQ